jgi:selenium-binding protein 1
MRNHPLKAMLLASLLPLASLSLTLHAIADETCLSPYTTSLIKGQEKYLQVWTLGVKGMGDESDKLVTIDVDPASKTYGKVINYVSVGGPGEAHHMGFTDDRKYIWAGRLDDNKIFVFDVGTDPTKPKLVNTIVDFDKKTGFVGPHTFYALPRRVLVGGLSNSKDHGGETGMAVYSNAGQFLAAVASTRPHMSGSDSSRQTKTNRHARTASYFSLRRNSNKKEIHDVQASIVFDQQTIWRS